MSDDMNAEIQRQFQQSRNRLSVTTPPTGEIDTTTPTDHDRLNSEAQDHFARRRLMNRLTGKELNK